jgi:hypothetical protein
MTPRRPIIGVDLRIEDVKVGRAPRRSREATRLPTAT